VSLPAGDTIGMFGQYGTDTRVSSYADLIMAQLYTPEPASLALAGLGVVVLLWRFRRGRMG